MHLLHYNTNEFSMIKYQITYLLHDKETKLLHNEAPINVNLHASNSALSRSSAQGVVHSHLRQPCAQRGRRRRPRLQPRSRSLAQCLHAGQAIVLKGIPPASHV